MDLEREMENFKNHIATFTDYGNIKILDFKDLNSSHHRIRFLFEEDYCRLHISGDLGELIATNYYNMTFDKFSDFVDNTGYFEEKIDCHNRAIWYYDEDKAREELTKYINENYWLDSYQPYSSMTDEEKLEEVLYDIMHNFDDRKGISEQGFEKLSELDSDAWGWAYSIGRKSTGILDLYMLAFKLAMGQIDKEKENGCLQD